MDETITRDQVIEEVGLVPEEKIPELYDIVYHFRVGHHHGSKSDILRFAGSWSTFADDEFQGFLDEVAERRAHAFTSRRKQ